MLIDERQVGCAALPPHPETESIGVADLPTKRNQAVFGVASRIGSQRDQSAGATHMSLIAELKQRNVFRVAAGRAAR